MRWIVPHRAGGGYDTYSRMIAPYLGENLGATVTVNNILGAGGMVGAATLRDAEPDGLTVGILDASGLLVSSLAGEQAAPNPSTDFTVLGRIARSQHVWATGRSSRLQTIDDVFEANDERSVVFGIRDVGSTSFVSIAIASSLLGLEPEFVAGFSGSGRAALAAMRGDVDIVSLNFGSISRHMDTGDLRPLLQISEGPIAAHPALDGIPVLGGTRGVAVHRTLSSGGNADQVRHDVAALVSLVGAGRLVVAPLDLQKPVRTCLEQALYAAVTDRRLRDTAARSGLSLDIAQGATAVADLRTVNDRVAEFLPIISRSIRSARD